MAVGMRIARVSKQMGFRLSPRLWDDMSETGCESLCAWTVLGSAPGRAMTGAESPER